MEYKILFCFNILLLMLSLGRDSEATTTQATPAEYEVSAYCISDKAKTKAHMAFSVTPKNNYKILDIYAMGDKADYNNPSSQMCKLANFTKSSSTYNLVLDLKDGLPSKPVDCSVKRVTGTTDSYTMGVIVITKLIIQKNPIFHMHTCDFSHENVFTAQTGVGIAAATNNPVGGTARQKLSMWGYAVLTLVWFACWK